MGNPFVNSNLTDGAFTGSAEVANMKSAPVSKTTGFVWDWQNQYIETDHTHMPSLAAQPDSTLFLVGPSRKSGLSGNEGVMSPVGYIQGIQATQQRAVQRLYDFGSARAFFTVGKTQGSLNLTRLFFKGANLLATLYQNALGNTGDGSSSYNDMSTGVFNENMYSAPGILKSDGNDDTSGFFIDIGSELFLNPFGCAIIYRSKTGHAIGGVYFELCMFDTHTIQMDPNTPQMMENVNVQFDRAIAFDFNSSTENKKGSS